MSQTQDLLTEAVELLRAIAGYTANLEDVLRENTEAVNKWGASLEDRLNHIEANTFRR